MEKLLAEYFLNSIWQVMLLVAAAWLLVRVLRPSPLAQYCIWLGLLPLALAMPLLSLHSGIAPHVVPAPPPPLTAILTPPTQALAPHLQLRALGWQQPIPARSRVQPLTPSPTTPPPAAATTRIHWPVREVQLSPSTTRLLVGLYLTTILFALVRLLLGGRAARRILHGAAPAQLSPADSHLLDRCSLRLGVRSPAILESPAAASPMLVGIARPSLLLPPGITGQSHDSAGRSNPLEAILLHELAHLRRRDCLANLLCRVAALPIAYHPAAWAISRRIRQSQEMLCDAIAAAAMQSPVSYARCLVGLAQTLQPGSEPLAQLYGATMFDGKILEERVMRLIETKNPTGPCTRIVRLVCGVMVMLAALAAASLIHLAPTFAQAKTPPAVQAAVPALAANPMLAQALQPSQPSQTTQPSQPSQAQRPAAAAPVPAAQSAGSADPPTPTPAEINDLQIRYDYARKMYDAVVARQADLIAHGNNAAASSADLKERLVEARAQYENLSIVMEDAVQKHNEALAKRQTYLESIARAQQQAQQAQLNAQAVQEQQHLELFAREKQQLEAMEELHDSEIDQLARAQARLNDPEVKKQIDSITGAELQKQLSDAEKQIDNVTTAERQLTEALAKLNNPEIKKQIDSITSADLQKQLSDAAQQLAVYQARMADLSRQIQQQQAMLRNSLRDHPAPQSAPLAPAKAP